MDFCSANGRSGECGWPAETPATRAFRQRKSSVSCLPAWKKLALPLIVAFCCFGGSAHGATSVLGLDVYSGNGTMNWPKIAATGKQFAFVKATEGTDFKDPDLDSNEANGTAAGMYIGCYDFAHPEDDTPAQEADYFVAYALPTHAFSAGHLVPALDLEDGAGDTLKGASSLCAWCNDWCADVFALTSVHAVIYANTNYANNYLNSTVIDNPLWIASPSYNPTTYPNVISPWKTWTFWQYGQGAVNGDPAPVADLDQYNGSLASLISHEVIPAPEPAMLPSIMAVAALVFQRTRRSRSQFGQSRETK
jgi:GH25 family lysozyme M1 (1,4-beta-N-acetylmuramidase)